MPLAKNQIIQLQIDSLSSDGNGVGRFEGQVIFVPACAPGDTLDVRIVKTAKNHAFGKIENIACSGAGRQASDCPISAYCGGCSFRHILYNTELIAKQGFVQDALRRIGGQTITCLPILPSPQEHHYRNKAQYPVTQNDEGELVYGFYAQRSHRIIPFDKCRLQPEIVNSIASYAAESLHQLGVTGYNEAQGSGLVRHICIRKAVHTEETLLCLVLTSPSFPCQKEFIAAMVNKFPCITSIVFNINKKRTNVIYGEKNLAVFGCGEMQDSIAGVPLWLGPVSFSQVNTYGAELLFSIVKEWAALQPEDILLDLYCGAGVIGLSMASACKKMIGVEIVPESIQSARRSAQAMGLSNTSFYCEDAGSAAARLAAEGIRPDVITVDPPRKGCDTATLQAIITMQPRRIVMVSCNPATMARDVAVLADNGYTIQKVQPVDMFPRTRHVECIVLLERNR